MAKKYKEILLLILIIIFLPFHSFAEENKLDKPFDKDYYFYSSMSSNFYTKFGGEVSISNQFNDYFEIIETYSNNSRFDESYNNSNTSLISSLKFYPFKTENPFFIEGGLGFTLKDEKNPDYNIKTTPLIYYTGLGYDIGLGKGNQLSILLLYNNLINKDTFSETIYYQNVNILKNSLFDNFLYYLNNILLKISLVARIN